MRSIRRAHALVGDLTGAAGLGLTGLGVRAQLVMRHGIASDGGGRSVREHPDAAQPRDAGEAQASLSLMVVLVVIVLAIAAVIVVKLMGSAQTSDLTPSSP
jgi:hypothetical protein